MKRKPINGHPLATASALAALLAVSATAPAGNWMGKVSPHDLEARGLPVPGADVHSADIVDTAVAADVVNLDSAQTVQGGSIAVDTASGVTVDGARVVQTDIVASNGIIHVIDAVIMPQ